MMTHLDALLLTLGTLVISMLLSLFRVALDKRYPDWVAALSRMLVLVAGYVYPVRREQWWADLLYVQQVEQQSGIYQAWSCFTSAPWLLVRDVMTRRWWRESWTMTRGRSVVAGLSLILGTGFCIVGVTVVLWIAAAGRNASLAMWLADGLVVGLGGIVVAWLVGEFDGRRREHSRR